MPGLEFKTCSETSFWLTTRSPDKVVRTILLLLSSGDVYSGAHSNHNGRIGLGDNLCKPRLSSIVEHCQTTGYYPREQKSLSDLGYQCEAAWAELWVQGAVGLTLIQTTAFHVYCNGCKEYHGASMLFCKGSENRKIYTTNIEICMSDKTSDLCLNPTSET